MASNNLELIIKLAKEEAEASAKEFADNTTKNLNSIEANVKLNTFIMVLKDSFRAAKKVVQELTEAVGSLAEASEAFNIPVTRLGGAWNEVKKNIGDVLANSPEFKEFTQVIGRSLNQMSAWAASADGGKAIVGVFKDLTKAMLTTLSVGTNFLEFLAATKDSWKNMAAPLEVSKNALTGMLELTVSKAANSAESIRKFRVEVDKLRESLDQPDGPKTFGPELPPFNAFGAQTDKEKEASDRSKKTAKEYADWLKKFKEEKAKEEADSIQKNLDFADAAHRKSAARKIAIDKNYADTTQGVRDWTAQQEKAARASELQALEAQAAEDVAIDQAKHKQKVDLIVSVAAPALSSAFADIGRGADSLGGIVEKMLGTIIMTMGNMLLAAGMTAVGMGTASTAVPVMWPFFGGPMGAAGGAAAMAVGAGLIAAGAAIGGSSNAHLGGGGGGGAGRSPGLSTARAASMSSSNGLSSQGGEMGFGSGFGGGSKDSTTVYNINFGSGVITGTPSQVARTIRSVMRDANTSLGG